MRRRPRVAVLLVFALIGSLLSVAQVAVAQQQNEIVLSVDFDGTPAFSAADPLDDGLGAHTPGLDLNANNSVVRTHDQVQYRIDWNVNEVDGTGVTLRMTLPQGVEWLEDGSTVTGVPSGCTDDGTSSYTGNSGRDLVCVTDAEHEGSNGAIHPRALVTALLDGTALTVDASVETGEAAPVVSNQITTVVSARPAGDWIKGKPIVDADSGDVIAYEPDEEYFLVDGPSPADPSTLVPGRLFVWNLRLEPAGGLKGSEPMNDAVQIDLYDHFFDSVPGTILATPAQMLAATGQNRVPCGGYDGADGYPFGVTAGVASTTPANQTNVGTWTCTDITGTAGTGYPVVQIAINGQDTTNIAPLNANAAPNSSTLASGQIAFWAPETELIAKTPIPRIIVNAITGTPTAVPFGSTEVDPILVHGTNDPVPEISESGSGQAGVSNNSPYEFPTAPPSEPGRSYRHWTRYQNGPYAEIELEDFLGRTYRSYDRRAEVFGGTGRGITNGQDGVDGVLADFFAQRWDGDGQTPRGNVLTVQSGLQTLQSRVPTNGHVEPVHLCTAVDTTHQEVIGLPATYPVSVLAPYVGTNFGASSYANSRVNAGGYSATPTSPVAQVLIGPTGTALWYPLANVSPGVRTDLGEQIDYVIEVASAAPVTNAVGINELTCNGDEADARGWVDAQTGDLSVFATGTAPDGSTIYGDITRFRVRTLGDVPWSFPDPLTVTSYGTRIELNYQVRVKDDPIAQAADQELFVYASRASGDWDGTGQPPTPRCTNWTAFLNRDGDDPDTDGDGMFDFNERDLSDDDNYDNATENPGIPEGWCNLDFTDDGSSSTDLGDFKNDFDSSVVETVRQADGRPLAAHADAIYIVEPALAISKANTDGPADITANGGIVEFEINPRVVGSSLDTIANVRVADVLPSTMSFVGFTSLPSQGTCTETGGTIFCTYGSQAGGWGSLGEGRFSFEVQIQNAGANATLTNVASIAGEDPLTGAARTPASARASAFTGAPFEESGIEKAVDAHLTDCFDAPGTGHDPGDCTVIAVDGGMLFTLDVENEGNVDLEDYRVIDVLPHLADATEPAAAPHPLSGVALTGDGRTPPSAFSGAVEFVSATAPGATVLYSADDPTTISRDPAVADSGTTWCNAPAGGTAVAAGLAPAAGTNPCPATAAEVTAVHLDLGTLLKGETRLVEVALTTVGATCGDIWTNNFGARTTGLKLQIRSNDVSVMAGFCDPSIDIEKSTNGLDSDVPNGAQIVAGDPVVWTYDVTNDGGIPLIDATVTDSDPAVVVDCDVDGDGVLDGTNVIPLLLPGDVVTCEANGTAVVGPYSNTADVSGSPALPDFSDPAVDPSDPSTWPTDASGYSDIIDPATGDPFDDPADADDSHYTGIDPVPAIDIEKDTNGLQSDVAPGAPLVPGQAVTWTYAVTNTGTGALIDAVVTDVGSDGVPITVDCDVDGDGVLDGTNVIPILVPGASVTCESTGVAGSVDYSNNASVTGNLALPTEACVCDPADPSTWPTDPADYEEYVDPVTGEPSTVDDEDPSHYTPAAPAIDIEKSTNGVDSDVAPGETLFAGAPVTWSYVVTNTGSTALLDATVADSDPAVVVDCDVDGDGVLDGTNVIPFLAFGASVTCEATGTAITGAYANTATVGGDPVTPDPATCGCDPLDPTTWPAGPEGYVPAVGDNGFPFSPVSDADDSHYTGLPFGPGVGIEKSTNGVDSDEAPGEQILAGAPVTWSYVVTNTGSTALIDATVADSDPTLVVDCDVDGDGVLDGTNVIPFIAVGGQVSCEATGVAGDTDYANTATISGTPVSPDPATCGCDPLDPSTWPSDPGGYIPATGANGLPFGPVDAADDSHYAGLPSDFDLALDKVLAPGQESSVAIGADVTFIITVTNEGDLDAIDVEITDTLPTSMTLNDADWTDSGDGSAVHAIAGPIIPGESVDVEITVTVTAAGSLENNAEITGATAALEGEPLDGTITDIDSSPNDGLDGQDDLGQAAVTVASPSTVPRTPLAFTGAESGSLVAIALALILLGGVFLGLRRRED